VIWYYTFGVNCIKSSVAATPTCSTSSRIKALHVQQSGPGIRVPSAPAGLCRFARRFERTLAGRYLDSSTQDLPDRLPTDEDTWYFSRSAARSRNAPVGTASDAEQLSAASFARVPIRRGRAGPIRRQRHDARRGQETRPQVLGFELSPNYAAQAQARLDTISEGQPLEGAAEPKLSDRPTTSTARRKRRQRSQEQFKRRLAAKKG